MTQLVFVPLDREAVQALRRGAGRPSSPGCAATPGLAGTLGPDTATDEQEFAALNSAGVLALSATTDPLRLVVAAEVAAAQMLDHGGPTGQVSVRDLRWAQVHALFGDEPAAATAVARARAALGAMDLAEALSVPAVTALVDEFDLLWFAPDELDDL
jgi:hypothetical protein